MIINIIKLANVLALSTFVLACAPVANQLDQKENQRKVSTIDKSKVNNISVYAVLQKHTNAEFEIPYQDYYMSEKQRHFGFNRLYSKDPPRYSYIPTFNLQKISRHVLLRETSRRIRDRLFK